MKRIIAIPLAMLPMLLLLLATACKKDKKDTVTTPTNPNEEELITTFRITFTDSAGVYPDVTAQFVDIDGPGGNDPSVFDTIRLHAGTTYYATITLWDESSTPATNISDEVEEEGQDHLFCFNIGNPLNLLIVRTDSDGVYPIGLQSKWTTQAISAGDVMITLRHQPGVKNGTCDPGETDIELTFHTILE